MNSLFLIDSLSTLRTKINRLAGPMETMWSNMRGLIHTRPDVTWMLTPFVAVVTAEKSDIETARREMLTYFRRLPGRSLSIDVQQDFWCPSFQVARMGIYYSWLRELGWISDAEAAECEQILLDYAFAHMYTSGLTKHDTDITNNQTLSLSFGCTVVGHLLGYRLNASPAARMIMAEGLKHLRLRVSNMPRGGWSGEGSTYQAQVVGPGVSLASIALEAITGKDVFFRRENPDCATPAEVAEMAHRCTMPDGLMLPWDNYGFFVSQISLTSAVLARKKQDNSYLNWVAKLRLNKPYIHFGWGRDEKALSLLFWPDNACTGTSRAFPGWASEDVGGQYVSPDEQIGFFQMCDEHGAGMEVGRPECNPNHVVYGAFGAQLFTDGRVANSSVFRFPGCQKKVATITGMAERNWSCGSPGAHSCLLIDGQEGYIPTRRTHGKVECFENLGETALISTESAASYQPTYDVTSVRRTTALFAGGRALVIRDHVEALTPHSYQSRFYLRPAIRETSPQNGLPGFVVDTPECVRFHLFALDKCSVSRKEIAGFPAVFEGRSALLDFNHAAPGTRSEFNLLVLSEELVEPLSDVTEGWGVYGGPSLNEQQTRSMLVPIDAYLVARPELKSDRVVTLRKTLSFESVPFAREICLRLPLGLRKCPVFVNGQPVSTELPDEFRPAQDSEGGFNSTPALLLHPWITLKKAEDSWTGPCEVTVVFERVTGSNHLYSDLLADAFPLGYGPAALGAVRKEIFEPAISYDKGLLRISGLRGKTITADLNRMEFSPPLCELRKAPNAGGDLKEENSLKYRPVKPELDGDTIRLGQLNESFKITVERYDAPAEIDWHGGTLQVAYRGLRNLKLFFSSDDVLAVIVNGVFMRTADKGEHVVCLSGANTAAKPYAQDAALARCWEGASDASAAELISLLAHDDWQVRMAAALTLGERREEGAREALLACLDAERDEEIFENKKAYCWFVRGNADAFEGDKTPIRREDDPARFAAWSRRWRLKGQISRALGRIGGPGVEEALLRSIKDGQDFHYYVCVCQALRDCGTEKSLPALERFLNYEEWCTQRYAQDAVGAIASRCAAASQRIQEEKRAEQASAAAGH